MNGIRRTKLPIGASLEDKLTKNFTITQSGCWEYNSATYGKGYRTIAINGKNKYAHRVSYEYYRGPIPEGLVVDHLCHNRACINPDHLRVCTQKQNVEGVQKPILICPKCGGKRVAYTDKNGRTKRLCKKCTNERARINHAKRRLKAGLSIGHPEHPFCDKHQCKKRRVNWKKGQCKWYCPQCNHERYLKRKARLKGIDSVDLTW